VAQFEPHKQKLDELQATLVYIAAEKRNGAWKPSKYFSEHPISFPFLLDENRAVTKAYGVYHALGHDAFRIAHPATLIVDRSGNIRYICRGDNQTDFAPVDEVLDAVRNIR
jgi:peroxiredoxin